MKLNKNAKVFYHQQEKDLSKTTHLCFSAHQDDIEIMAYAPIYECYMSKDNYFTAVNITDGAGSPRTGKFENFTNEEMVETRIDEQNKAADIGKYLAVIMLMYPSKDVKDRENKNVVEDIKNIILETKPKYIYTHNLMDKHLSHVASTIKVIEALREIKNIYRPEEVVGLEVWRGLDWLSSKDKIYFDTSKNQSLQQKLLDVYESQIQGGKRYDLATLGRRYSNSTFLESHSTDNYKSLNYGVNMTEFVYSDKTYVDFVSEKIENFKNEIFNDLKILM